MMRRAPIPHTACGSARFVAVVMAGCDLCARSPCWPRSPSSSRSLRCRRRRRTRAFRRRRRQQILFAKKQGGILGPTPNIDSAQPLYLQADQLLYDTKNNRVIAQGNVEIYYNNYILTADQVVYDQAVNKLIAEGNAQLKDPNGGITRADRFEALDDFRDAFIQSLSVVTADDTRIAAERATRREGNTTEYERGKFTPCKNDPGMPPLWCIGAARIIHDQRAATITYQDAQFELFGVPVVYLPYFQHPDPSVKHRTRLPDAGATAVRARSVSASTCRTISPWRPTTTSPSIPGTGPTTAYCGRATGGIDWQTANTPCRLPPSTRAATGRRWRMSRSPAGAVRSRPRGNSRSRHGGGSDGTSRLTATRASAASTNSIRFCRPTASIPSICRA